MTEIEASPVLSFIAMSRPGARSDIEDTKYGYVTVIVDDNYTSALGEQCKKGRVYLSTNCMEVIALCQKDGHWAKMPQIWSSCSDSFAE